MITARINFLQNNITVNLSQTPIRLRDDLQNIGVLTSQNLILLDNSRTLKIELYPKDSCGKYILRLIDKESDTLGAVNKLCYSIRCMDARDKTHFFYTLKNGDYNTISDAQRDADKMREQRKIKNRQNKKYR